MFGPFRTILDHVWPNFTSRPARPLTFSRFGIYCLSKISIECFLFGTISGPCWDNVWPSFTSQPARVLKFWGLSQHRLRYMPSKYPFFGVISGPFFDYVGNSSRPNRAVNLKWVIMVWRHMSIECLLVGTTPGPCLDSVGIISDLALLPDQIELCKFEDWIKMV